MLWTMRAAATKPKVPVTKLAVPKPVLQSIGSLLLTGHGANRRPRINSRLP